MSINKGSMALLAELLPMINCHAADKQYGIPSARNRIHLVGYQPYLLANLLTIPYLADPEFDNQKRQFTGLRPINGASRLDTTTIASRQRIRAHLRQPALFL
ncbi:hypothetical protein K449DRAFT_430289 [Hypoxylon sp. EC38]|nr:hypothetical protein K449DRAFT_430289 [Hypoxylon sp. EC38]